MAIHTQFPKSPHEIIKPELRWFPADETLREKGYDKLLPPLVAVIVAVPEDIPLTNPALLTVAIEELLVDQVIA